MHGEKNLINHLSILKDHFVAITAFVSVCFQKNLLSITVFPLMKLVKCVRLFFFAMHGHKSIPIRFQVEFFFVSVRS